MDTPLTLTVREIKEIKHALWYEEHCNHGTVGHNLLVIVAKMARERGFFLDTASEQGIYIPQRVTITEKGV